jgi:hypothetical protein
VTREVLAPAKEEENMTNRQTDKYTLEWADFDTSGWLTMGEFETEQAAAEAFPSAYNEYLGQGGKPEAGNWLILKNDEIHRELHG